MGRSFLRIVCVASLLCALAHAQDGHDRFAAELRDDRVQLELPDRPAGGSDEDRSEGTTHAVPVESGDSSRKSRPWIRRRSPDHDTEGASKSFSFDLDAMGMLRVLGIAVIAALVVLALVVAASALRERRRGSIDVTSANETVANSETATPPSMPSLDDVDRLAGERRFTEAIHLLLLRAITMLAKTAPAAAQPAATSRELLRKLRLAPDPKAAFSRLVGEVERCHFGGVDATRERFEACREAHRVLDPTEPR